MRKTSKPLIVAMCALVAALGVNATMAWLTDTTDKVENTFTAGDINIELIEHDYIQSSNSLDKDKPVTAEGDYKMVPGNTMPKDPTVTVEKGSETCWLFVKVTESVNFDTFVDYAMAEGWSQLSGVSGVYYWEEPVALDAANDQPFGILAGDKVTVKSEVTKEMLTASDFTQPTISFAACAVQYDNLETVEEAWAEAPAAFKNA